MKAIHHFLIPLFLTAHPLTAADAKTPPPLRVSDNGRYLVTDQGAPVFLLADTAWGLIGRLKREEITEYLQHRQRQGFNAVTFVLYSPGNPDIADAHRNAYGHAPFAMVDDRPDVSRPSTDGYWELADFALAETTRLGLYAIVLPCWGSAVAGGYDGKPSRDQVFNAGNARPYGRWLGARYATQPHLLWMLGGDRRAVYENPPNDYRPVFHAMAEGLRAGGARQLASFHPPKNSPQSGDWFHDAPWLDFNSIQDWPDAQLAAVAADWQRPPAKPTWIFEGRYEAYWKKPYQPEQWGAWQCRQQAWQTVFAGAFGHTYGHERIFGFGKDGADWRRHLDAPGAQSMKHLARLMATWSPEQALSRVPDQTLIEGDTGKAERLTSDRLTATRSGDGTLAMIYSANGRTIAVRMANLAAPALHAAWFDPRTGETRPINDRLLSGPGAPVHEFDPPGIPAEGNDWVLVLQIDSNR